MVSDLISPPVSVMPPLPLIGMILRLEKAGDRLPRL
jgi:hypothetical protein